MLLEQKHDLAALRFVELALPLPSLLLAGLVIHLSINPWLTAGFVLVYVAGNAVVSHLALRRGRTFSLRVVEVRLVVNMLLLLGIGVVSGPDCPSMLMAVPALCGAPFIARDWRAWFGVAGSILAAFAGSLIAGAQLLDLAPIVIAEASVGVVLVAAVVQLRRRGYDLERALGDVSRASRVKSEFLAVMSHEVRTPLHGMMGVLSLIESKEIDADVREKIVMLSRCSDDILRVLADILEFSQLQSGQAEVDSETFELVGLIDETLETARVSAGSRAQALELRAELELDTTVCHRGPHEQIRKILGRLLENAVAFTPKGVITVRVTTSGKEHLRFEVQDTGAGIPPEQLPTIFDAFTQADSSTTRAHGGIGIGLAICKRTVELLGGTMGVDSELHKGSCFWFTLPCATIAATSEIDVPGPAADESSPTMPAKVPILAVDDNEINRRVIVAMLERLGYQVDTASDGLEAVERSAERFYPIILMDCYMPAMDGYEATRAIRKRDGTRSRIIGITANALSDAREQCLAAGMDDYVTKPVSLGQLRKRIENAATAS